MKSRKELTEQEIGKIKALSEKYDIPYDKVELRYCFSPCDDTFEFLEKKFKTIAHYRKLGVNDERTVDEIESLIHKINFYTRTIEALIKVGWSPAGVDGVITGFHNERAILINQVESINNHLLVVKQNRNHKGPFRAYNREEYLARRR